MSLKALNAAFEHPPILTEAGNVSLAARLLLLALADYADDAGRAWPSQITLARRTSMNERSIRDGFILLEQRGLIWREQRRRGDGARRTDVIHLIFLQPALTAGSGQDPPEPQDMDFVTTGTQLHDNRHSLPVI